MKASEIGKNAARAGVKSIGATTNRFGAAIKSFGSDLYGAKERKRVGINYAETIVSAIPTALYANPITLTVGAALSAVVLKAQTTLGAKMIEENLERHPPEHKYSPNLQTMMDRLYDISGLDVEENPVYDFKAKKSKDGKKNPLSEALDKMSLIPNAAASNINIPVIMISEALLELLNDDEEYAVLAHEFVHATAEHQKVTTPKKFVATAAATTNNLVRLLEYFSSGVLAIGASIAASLGAGYITETSERRPKVGKLYKELAIASKDSSLIALNSTCRAIGRKLGGNAEEKIEKVFNQSANEERKASVKQRWDVIGSIAKELSKKGKAETPEELLKHKRTTFARKTASQAAGVGVVSAFNPIYLPVYAATRALNAGLQVSNKRLSRIFEFHADEAAVTKFEAKPLALVTALRKITAIVERSQRNANGFASSDMQVSPLGSAWAKANMTHPPVAERAAALSVIARDMGFSEEEIDQAVNGQIDIDNIPDMPLEMAEQAAMMLHAGENAFTL